MTPLSTEVVSLAGAARLFGDLLLTELSRPTLMGLQADAPSQLLGAVGVAVPSVDGLDDEAVTALLDELASEFHAVFLAPSGGGAPPVASLWTEGRFEGAVAARVRQLAESAALDFGSDAARGAPVDHLGVLLHLWAATVERAPWAADEIAADLLGWAGAPLAQAKGRGGFYGSVAEAANELTRVIETTRVSQ